MSYPNPHGPSCPWYDITEKTGAPNIKWCEETLCQWITEPANAWSNLGYLIIACIITYLGIKHRHNFNLRQFGPIVFLMGLMSMFFHLSNFYGSQLLDFIGMFLFLGWAIGMNLVRLKKIRTSDLIKFNLILALIYSVITHFMYVKGYRFQAVVLLSGFMIMNLEYQARKIVQVNYTWFFATIGTLSLSFAFSLADGTRIWCDPTQHGWFAQGHAIWHWISSFAMLFLYLHFSQPALNPSETLKK